MNTRGRKQGIFNLEREILKLLSESNSELGFRQIHSIFSKQSKISKTTLSNSLKLLVSEHKIIKTKTRRYQINRNKDLLMNVKKLEWILSHLSDYFPKLSSKEEAFIGIKLWTLVFNNEFHPAKFFINDEYERLSNDYKQSGRIKAVRSFFESRNYTSMFEDKMHELFFDFCKNFNKTVLRDVINEIMESKLYTPISKNKDFLSLAMSFQSKISISRTDGKTFYGIAFCNILHSVKSHELSKVNLDKISKDMSKFDEKFLEI